jgi:biopolymer transport protein ExbB
MTKTNYITIWSSFILMVLCVTQVFAQAPAEVATPVAEKSFLSFFYDGGYVMIPLLGCSFILVMFSMERLISLRTGHIIPGPFVDRLLHQLEQGQIDREQALLVCEQDDSIAARVIAAAIKKWGRPAVEMDQALIDAGERVSHELRRFMRIFGGLYTIAPLLGLLGTVSGIIQAFAQIGSAEAMGRMELLSKSISEALYTTAMGLAVAIPAVVMSMYFSSCVDRLLIKLDALGQEVVDAISSEALQQRSPGRKKAA